MEAESTITSSVNTRLDPLDLIPWLLSGYEMMEAALDAARMKKTNLSADLKYEVD